jgi:hypothetical protein
MALGSEIEELRRERNRVVLANGAVKQQEEALRIMSWADFGLRFNVEPFHIEAVSTWVTLPGAVADSWLQTTDIHMSKAYDCRGHVAQCWRAASANLYPQPQLQGAGFAAVDLWGHAPDGEKGGAKWHGSVKGGAGDFHHLLVESKNGSKEGRRTPTPAAANCDGRSKWKREK